MAKQSPLQQVKSKFDSKEALVDKLVKLLDKGDESASELKDRLLSVANSKLLRLYEAHDAVAQRFGGKDKLVAEITQLMGRTKDSDLSQKLSSASPARLLDEHARWTKKSRARS